MGLDIRTDLFLVHPAEQFTNQDTNDCLQFPGCHHSLFLLWAFSVLRLTKELGDNSQITLSLGNRFLISKIPDGVNNFISIWNRWDR